MCSHDRVTWLPLIVVVYSLYKSYIVNKQIGVADYEYVVLDDLLPPGHVTRRMRIANFAIKFCHKNGPFTLLSAISQQRIKIKA